MTIAAIKEKLHHYIDVADDKKVEAIFTIMESDIEESLDLWEDENFVNEMNRRADELESGKVRGVTLEEFKSRH